LEENNQSEEKIDWKKMIISKNMFKKGNKISCRKGMKTRAEVNPEDLHSQVARKCWI